MQGKRLLGILQRTHADYEWRAMRARGLLSSDTVLVVGVQPQGANEATKQFGVNIKSVAENVKQQFQGADTSAW
eukprot:5560246-Pyramimonas_sp.AAC.1